MTLLRTTLRRTTTSRMRMLALLALAAAALSACTPTPEPTPTPTAAFDSEEEAFAAAEEVYRAYTDALNAQRAGDSSADPLDFLIGPALEDELAAYKAIEAQGLTLIGNSKVASFEPQSADINSTPVELLATVCVDISETKVLDASENNVTPIDRRELLPLRVTFVTNVTGLVISDSQSIDESSC